MSNTGQPPVYDGVQAVMVIGLPVFGSIIRVADLVNWIEARDASCAEYLAPALRQYMESGEEVS